MQIEQAIILGLVQGLTEFIPVSSSGHLILAERLLGIQSGLTFDVALHIGTLVALLVIFGGDFWRLLTGVISRRRPDVRLASFLILATIPAVIVGAILETRIESTMRTPTIVAINLFMVALLMLVADQVCKRLCTMKRHVSDVTPGKALVIGLAQAVALAPGVSRSGSTIMAGLFTGLDRISATRFSFLLSAPIIAGAIVKVLLNQEAMAQVSGDSTIFIIGIVTSFISGYAAIRFLLNYLAKHGLALFAYYRIALAAVVLVVLA